MQEARLVAVLKQPGERVKRDEPIYQMETDKAVMDVESPYDGVLVKWIGQIDELLRAEPTRHAFAAGLVAEERRGVLGLVEHIGAIAVHD